MFDSTFTSALKNAAAFGEPASQTFSANDEAGRTGPPTFDGVAGDVQRAIVSGDRTVIALRERWPKLDEEFRERLLNIACSNGLPIDSLQSLVASWRRLSHPVKTELTALIASHPRFAGDAGNFSAATGQPPVLALLATRWMRLPQAVRGDVLRAASDADRSVRNFSDLCAGWFSLPASVIAEIGAMLNQQQIFAAGQPLAKPRTAPVTATTPKMKIVAGRIVRGEEIFSAGHWRQMTRCESKLFAAGDA